MKSSPHNPQVPRRTGGEAEIADLYLQTVTQGHNEGGAEPLRAYLQVLKRRKWLVLMPLCVILPLVGWLLYDQPPKYEATAKLLIDPSSHRIVNIQEVARHRH